MEITLFGGPHAGTVIILRNPDTPFINADKGHYAPVTGEPETRWHWHSFKHKGDLKAIEEQKI